MIRDTTAQRIAAEWHSGQWSALYALSSTGAILGERNDEYDYNLAAREIADCAKHPSTNAADCARLGHLLAYVLAKGPRPAVPDWYERVIRIQE